MAAHTTQLATDPGIIRISEIAGRYLVFDAYAVSQLRRRENTNGTLIGTTPQQPTQNVFLGLPLELRPEEALALLRRNSAVVVDDVATHQSALGSTDKKLRRPYLESLRPGIRPGLKAARNTAYPLQGSSEQVAVPLDLGEESIPETAVAVNNPAEDVTGSAFGESLCGRDVVADAKSWAVTPASSSALFPYQGAAKVIEDTCPYGALCRFLQSKGNFMTPGLRFGAQYSVYPGDPLRFHAHFMANEYEWDEPIPMLDLVAGGRLATAVKKAFLVGGHQSNPCLSTVRTFSLEWAAM